MKCYDRNSYNRKTVFRDKCKELKISKKESTLFNLKYKQVFAKYFWMNAFNVRGCFAIR